LEDNFSLKVIFIEDNISWRIIPLGGIYQLEDNFSLKFILIEDNISWRIIPLGG
jgi:hypothetical protein